MTTRLNWKKSNYRNEYFDAVRWLPTHWQKQLYRFNSCRDIIDFSRLLKRQHELSQMLMAVEQQETSLNEIRDELHRNLYDNWHKQLSYLKI